MTKARILLFLLGLALAACGPQGWESATGPWVWIDSPLDGAAFSDPTIEPLVFIHAAWPAGVSDVQMQWEYYENGILKRTSSWETEWGGSTLEEVAPGLFFQQLLVEADGPGLYRVRAKAADLDGDFGEIAQIEFVICELGEIGLEGKCFTAAVDEPIGTATPSEFQLLGVPNRDANCRLGPSASLFEIDDTLLLGMEYMPMAQGPDAMWTLYQGTVSGNRCWVFNDNLDFFCNEMPVEISDLSPCSLPIADYPPFPTLTPTFTPEGPTPTPRPLPQCSDGIDNDGDGNIDMTDGRCSSPDDDSESS